MKSDKQNQMKHGFAYSPSHLVSQYGRSESRLVPSPSTASRLVLWLALTQRILVCQNLAFIRRPSKAESKHISKFPLLMRYPAARKGKTDVDYRSSLVSSLNQGYVSSQNGDQVGVIPPTVALPISKLKSFSVAHLDSRLTMMMMRY